MIALGLTSVGAALVLLTWALLTGQSLDRRTDDQELASDIRHIQFVILISWAATVTAAGAFWFVFTSA